MKLASYKGKKRLFNRVVSWWTRGPYSHTELVFSDGTAISSSFMDCGVRYRRIQFTADNWDFVELGQLFDENEIRNKADLLLGKKFDVLGLAGFILSRIRDDKQKFFCSELCLHLLGFRDPWRFNPNTAHCAVSKLADSNRG